MVMNSCAIGTTLWAEGSVQLFQLQTPLAKHLLQYRVRQQPQLLGVNLQGNMTIAEVISRLQQG
jgi:hypothetical protein|tara:strand:- start:769 stop:960 length:192 start_codon:yes stop_codon:yes gene_type:complete